MGKQVCLFIFSKFLFHTVLLFLFHMIPDLTSMFFDLMLVSVFSLLAMFVVKKPQGKGKKQEKKTLERV